MPLLMLMLIARAEAGEPREITYTEAARRLDPLLRSFGPKHITSAHYPFWHLANNDAGIWVIPSADALKPGKRSTRPNLGEFKRVNPVAEVPLGPWTILRQNRRLRRELTRRLLDENWPATLHQAILRDLGLPEDGRITREVAPRDAQFRIAVLSAYENRCSVCGFDAVLGTRHFGVDAAHILWHSRGGPDEVSNGLALCALHHRGFDEGALGVDEEFTVLISPLLQPDPVVRAAFHDFEGHRIHVPDGEDRPGLEHLRWHRDEVFRHLAG